MKGRLCALAGIDIEVRALLECGSDKLAAGLFNLFRNVTICSMSSRLPHVNLEGVHFLFLVFQFFSSVQYFHRKNYCTRVCWRRGERNKIGKETRPRRGRPSQRDRGETLSIGLESTLFSILCSYTSSPDCAKETGNDILFCEFAIHGSP